MTNQSIRKIAVRPSRMNLLLFVSALVWVVLIAWLGRPPSPFIPPENWPAIDLPSGTSTGLDYDCFESLAGGGMCEPNAYRVSSASDILPYISEQEATHRRVVFLAEIEAWPIVAALGGLAWLVAGKKRRSQVGRISAA